MEREKQRESKVRRLELLANRLVHNLLAGNYRSTFRGRGIEFDETREYVDGDDVRLIDWNVSSRFGAVYTKTFREERELTLFFAVDVSSSLYFGSRSSRSIEQASEILALLALAAEKNGDKVGAVFFSDKIERWCPPRKDRKYMLGLAFNLLQFERPRACSDLGAALNTVNQSLKRRGFCVVISDFCAKDYQKDFRILAQRHEVVAIRLCDPAEKLLPREGLVLWEDPETGAALPAFTSTQRFRTKYHQYWKEHRAQWIRLCRRCNVSYLEISNDEDASETLIRFFQRRKSGKR